MNLRLYVPWCSQSEARRTLKDRIIGEDLGFTKAMMKFAVRHWVADNSTFDKREVDKLQKLCRRRAHSCVAVARTAFAGRCGKVFLGTNTALRCSSMSVPFLGFSFRRCG
ncbi:MAG: hypothetical protein QM784_09860 [Polyangiaceae bacterium]